MYKREAGIDWHCRFQEAALDPAQWMPALEQLAEATGSSRAELVGFGGHSFAPFNWVTSTNDTILREFHQASGTSPLANFRLAADDGVSTMKIVDERDYDLARTRLTTDDYLDFCEQNGMVYGCQTALHREPHGLVGLSLLRTRADGRTDAATRRIFAEAARAARTAVRMQRVIEQQGIQLLAGALGAIALPCLLLDGFGQVQAVTDSARTLIDGETLLTLTSQRLTSQDPNVARSLDTDFRSILGDGGRHHAQSALGSPSHPRLVVDMFRLPPREWAMRFAPRAIVVLRDPKGKRRHDGAILATTFGLTRAETEVAIALCDGAPRQAIAADRGVSLETLRTQIRSLYSKTGCGRESELVLMLRAMLG